MPGRTVATRVRVRYAETDGQRVAHHAAYFAWFELGRAEFLRAREVDYNALEDRGMRLIVVEAAARYLSPARYDDLVEIRATLEACRSREVVFTYSVVRDRTTLATGRTSLAMLSAAGRPMAIPRDVRTALEQAGPPPPERGDAIVGPWA